MVSQFGLIRGHSDSDGLDFGGAELEFGDFAKGVELRVGQDVGSRLGVAERHKYHTRRDIAVGTRLQLDARFHVNEAGSTASVVELSVDYGLRGPLAQFSRSGIVELVAAEVVQQAARNLEARLSGGAAAVPAPVCAPTIGTAP